MARIINHEVETRRLRRVEYDRLVEFGMFTGERLELLDGLLVVTGFAAEGTLIQGALWAPATGPRPGDG
jgi:hypothetical protein